MYNYYGELSPRERKELVTHDMEDEVRHEERFFLQEEADYEIWKQEQKALILEEQEAKEQSKLKLYHEVPPFFFKRISLKDSEMKVFMGFLGFTNINTMLTQVSTSTVARITGKSHPRIYEYINPLYKKGLLKTMKKFKLDDDKIMVERKVIFLPYRKKKKSEFETLARIKLPIEFLKNELVNLNGRELQVFCAYLCFTNTINLAVASIKDLQKIAGGSLSGIKKAIASLIVKGYLENTKYKDGRAIFKKIVFFPNGQNTKTSFECPYHQYGVVFGKSWQSYEECNDCLIQNECQVSNSLEDFKVQPPAIKKCRV